VLLAVDGEGHRRSLPDGTGVEVPESLAGFGIGCGEGATAFTVEDEAAGSGEDAGVVGFRSADLDLFPDDLAGLDVEGPENLLRGIGWVVVGDEPGARLTVEVAIFNGHHVEKFCLGIVGGGIPIGRSSYGRTSDGAAHGGLGFFVDDGAAFRVEASGPSKALDERSAEEEFAVCAIEDVEETVAVGLEEELARLALEYFIDQHKWLGGVPIPEVVGGELEVPFDLAGLGV